MKVVVAEDDAALSLFLTKALEQEGHAVKSVADGTSALKHIQNDAPDIVVLDLGLRQLDGVDVLRALHGSVASTSILVLTGRSDLPLRVECLNLGADDYMTKPFSMFELIARVRAISRRRHAVGTSVLHFGLLRVDRMERTVVYGDLAIDFTAKEYLLLEYLLQHKGESVSRSELLAKVWHMSPDAGTNVVDVYINYLRRKLSQVGALGLIETVRGEGYGIGVKQSPPTAELRFGPGSHSPENFSTTLEVA